MDLRQVALGAVFGAAVAVNAALQSLQDAGSFLIQGSSSVSSSASAPSVTPRPRKRPFLNPDASAHTDQASFFRAFLNDEEIGDGAAFEASVSDERLLTALSATPTPSIGTSAVFVQEDPSVLGDSHHGPRKLQVKRKSMEVASVKDEFKTECYLKSNDEEEVSSTEDGDVEWDKSNTVMNTQTTMTRRVQRPIFIPLLPHVVQSEEAMSAMLRHTTNSVLETLSEAKEQREKMTVKVKGVHLPEEEQTSLLLMSRFIDALVNVSDSLQVVHSALFSRTDGPERAERGNARES